MPGHFRWGVTIGLCFLNVVITAVFTCCGDNAAQASSAYKGNTLIYAYIVDYWYDCYMILSIQIQLIFKMC